MKSKLMIAVFAASIAGPALAGDPIVLNSQINLGPIQGALNVVVKKANEAASTATAIANTASVHVEGRPVEIKNDQSNQGVVTANSSVTAEQIAGPTIATSLAYGNALQTGGVDAPTLLGGPQVNAAGEEGLRPDVTATTLVALDKGSSIAASAAAIQNVSTSTLQGGDFTAQVSQSAQANSSASSASFALEAFGGTTNTAVANANAFSSHTSGATVDVDLQQSANGELTFASSEIGIAAAKDVVGAANALANNATIDNSFGFVDVTATQDNTSFVRAESFVTLENFDGFGSSTAFGVGNSLTVSNFGSDVLVDATQTNQADIVSISEFAGSSFQGAFASTNATAFGNALTATTCSTCGAAVTGFSRQVNAGQVTAQSVLVGGTLGSAIGSSAAIGNSATFQSVRVD